MKKTNKNNVLHKDTLCGLPPEDCDPRSCAEEKHHCEHALSQMLEQADRLYDEKRDREMGI
jgi:hypothetical protein